MVPSQFEFKNVLKRRRSRQSISNPVNVDFEYVGDSAGAMHHLVKKGNKDQLNFQLNLRRHKNLTDFCHEAPFVYPSTKEFRPEVTPKTHKDYVSGKNVNFAKKDFEDRVDEKNVNQILCLVDNAANKGSTGCYQQYAWQTSLRSDRKERNEARAAAAKNKNQ